MNRIWRTIKPETPRESLQKCLYDVSSYYPVDTVANVCFEVENVQRSFETLSQMGCSFLVPPTSLRDENGVVTYSVVKSIVGNVRHTLIDKSQYEGSFLPGFKVIEEARKPEDEEETAACPVTHFDHITYACPRRFTHEVMEWYERMFGFKRFFISSHEDPEEASCWTRRASGARLQVCHRRVAPEQGRNQVDRFLEEHRGAGIQHIGLYTSDIVSTAHSMSQAGVRFFSPPPAYYTEVSLAYYTEIGKQQEIVEAGHSPELLSRHGILLDTDLQQRDGRRDTSGEEEVSKLTACVVLLRVLVQYLLQVFTQPLFAQDTFFLELIERRGASGFGEGNIRALWKSVQGYMEKEENDHDAALKSAKS
ncbi:hypothetical protein WMY93_010087 [Mugilogobius chulae]|uniref:VOC domain-containing protein n=1 Tax=Mugilogobius chulae TaxID=88201 RepID=A0AAW0P6J0_9GOBI